MKPAEKPEQSPASVEPAHPFKQIGLAAVMAATHAMKPKQDEPTMKKETLPLLQEHWVL